MEAEDKERARTSSSASTPGAGLVVAWIKAVLHPRHLLKPRTLFVVALLITAALYRLTSWEGQLSRDLETLEKVLQEQVKLQQEAVLHIVEEDEKEDAEAAGLPVFVEDEVPVAAPKREKQTEQQRIQQSLVELALMPELSWPGGSRYLHPLPPSWPNPWPLRAEIASVFLSEERWPPPQDALGVDADSARNRKRRNEIGLGTKPAPAHFEVPPAHAEKVAVWARDLGREAMRLLSADRKQIGEGYDDRARPFMIERAKVWNGSAIGWKPPVLESAKALPKVQHPFAPLSQPEKIRDSQRKEWVRRAMLHIWEEYKRNAWGYDELRPLSGGRTLKFNGWGASIIDTLDTLLLMGLKDEYLLARKHVAEVDFGYLAPTDPSRYPSPAEFNLPPLSVIRPFAGGAQLPEGLHSPAHIPTFETVIRYLGGLLGAYDLSGDPLMLERARELGDWLLPALGTRSGLALKEYRLGRNPDGGATGSCVLAEVGSLSLEFTRLSQLTGDPAYFNAVQRTTDTMHKWEARERLPDLFPTVFSPEEPLFLNGIYSFGGQGDSYYEYLLKMHQLLQGALPQYSKMYASAIDSAHKHLIRGIKVVTGVEGMVSFGDIHLNEKYGDKHISWYANRLDHLTAFAAGMMALGGKLLDRAKDLDAGVNFLRACLWACNATATGLSPEIIHLYSESDISRWEPVIMADGTKAKRVRGDPMGYHSGNNHEIGRPETAESIWYLYRVTGDRTYQDHGWQLFTSWVEHTIVEGGFAHIDDVNSVQPVHEDGGVESFVMAETLKYYYLLFCEPDVLSLDDYVFTTEAHPLRIPKDGQDTTPPFWQDGPKLEMPHGPIGQGTPPQNWARLQQAAAANGWRPEL